MALITRYFSTTAAGAGDGTTWADRAALITTGNWSTVITGFDFGGSDAMLALVGPGTYGPITTSLAATAWTGGGLVAPTILNPLMFHGCDSSGVALAPPDPDWSADMPAWDSTGMPELTTTSNVQMCTVAPVYYRLLKLSTTARNGSITGGAAYEWCVISSSYGGATTSILLSTDRISNCALIYTGTQYSSVLSVGATPRVNNVRINGVAGTSGNRRGLSIPPTSAINGSIDRVCVVGCGGIGVELVSTSPGCGIDVSHATVVGCGGIGIQAANPTGPTNFARITDAIITGCGGVGVHGGNGSTWVKNVRLRDNNSGGDQYASLGNYPATDVYATAGTDADEYNDATNGDYRIKATASFANRGIGVSQMPASGSTIIIIEGDD